MESIHRYMIIKDDKNNAADKLTDLWSLLTILGNVITRAKAIKDINKNIYNRKAYEDLKNSGLSSGRCQIRVDDINFVMSQSKTFLVFTHSFNLYNNS